MACQQPAPADLAMHPETGDDTAWASWAAEVYGYVKKWFAKDAVEAACLQSLRDQGVIR